jgi:hypothetical protein
MTSRGRKEAQLGWLAGARLSYPDRAFRLWWLSTTLVLDADLDLLLWRRNHFVFLVTSKLGQLDEGFFYDVQSGLDFLLGNDERRRETDDVLVSRFGLQAACQY